MKLVYKPEDGEEQSWTYKPGKVRAGDAELIERRTGMSWSEFGQSLASGNAKCRRALLWHFLRQTHPTLRFEDVDFAMGELTLEFDRDEMAVIRDNIAKAPMPEGQEQLREVMLAQVDEQTAQAPESEGKARASSGG